MNVINDAELLLSALHAMIDSVKTVSETMKAVTDELARQGIEPRRIDSIRNLLNLSAYDIGEITKEVERSNNV